MQIGALIATAHPEVDAAGLALADDEFVMFLTPSGVRQRCPVLAKRRTEPRLLVSFHPRRLVATPCAQPELFGTKWAGWIATADERLSAPAKHVMANIEQARYFQAGELDVSKLNERLETAERVGQRHAFIRELSLREADHDLERLAHRSGRPLARAAVGHAGIAPRARIVG